MRGIRGGPLESADPSFEAPQSFSSTRWKSQSLAPKASETPTHPDPDVLLVLVPSCLQTSVSLRALQRPVLRPLVWLFLGNIVIVKLQFRARGLRQLCTPPSPSICFFPAFPTQIQPR
ncbi:hypothetical protein KUCAC02_037199 [Chaenocephalus aceratus]|nr:hypothetical protein KUCAC02_037199 [Chaenocephalus aceratus]